MAPALSIFQLALALALALAGLGAAQVVTNTSSVAVSSPSAAPVNGTTSSTTSSGPGSLVTSFDFSVNDLWDIVIGPVSSANTTTTVEATPVPSSSLIPPPFLTSYAFPTGRQVPETSENKSWSFPKDFMLGVAGAAYQIEGAAQAEGRGPSVWDRLTHNVINYVSDNQTGDVTDNNYYLYKQDIARLAAMGIKSYSFSISWSRIYPFGAGAVNEAGIAHYNDLIDTCLQYNMTPVATLFHWDTPLLLQERYGGWLGEQIVDDFAAYARTCFARFGDRVKTWFTVNEPIVFCNQYPLPAQYFKNLTIPYRHQPFVCGRNAVLAHAQAYRIAKATIPGGQGNGSLVSFKNNGGLKIPLTNSTADAAAVQRAYDFNEGWFADPVFLTGDWPASLGAFVSGFLPAFSEAEKALIRGSADVFAHDAYTAQFYFAPDSGVDACAADPSNPLYPTCANTSYTYGPQDGGWLIGPAATPGSPWLHQATGWLPALARYINDTWAPPAGRMIFSEFGFAEPFEDRKTLLPDILTDPVRTMYFRDYMHAVLISLNEGFNVLGCFAWSFVDNLEWSSGTSIKFGLQYVNFSSPALDRHYKASFFQYVDVYNKYVEK